MARLAVDFRQRLSHDGRVRPKVGIGRGRALIPSSGMGAFLYGYECCLGQTSQGRLHEQMFGVTSKFLWPGDC